VDDGSVETLAVAVMLDFDIVTGGLLVGDAAAEEVGAKY
jgi:hypothetical protein